MKRNPNGQLTQIYTDELFTETVCGIGNATASEVAETIGCNKVVATNRLKALVESGNLKSKKVSGRWIFWA